MITAVAYLVIMVGGSYLYKTVDDHLIEKQNKAYEEKKAIEHAEWEKQEAIRKAEEAKIEAARQAEYDRMKAESIAQAEAEYEESLKRFRVTWASGVDYIQQNTEDKKLLTVFCVHPFHVEQAAALVTAQKPEKVSEMYPSCKVYGSQSKPWKFTVLSRNNLLNYAEGMLELPNYKPLRVFTIINERN
jgi:hypothetical protein